MYKIENIQKLILRFVYNNYTFDYQTLLHKSKKRRMEVRRLRVLALEVIHSLNTLSPVYKQSLFEKNVNFKRYKDYIKVPIRNSVTFGYKSARFSGSQISTMLPVELKQETLYGKFKRN